MPLPQILTERRASHPQTERLGVARSEAMMFSLHVLLEVVFISVFGAAQLTTEVLCHEMFAGHVRLQVSLARHVFSAEVTDILAVTVKHLKQVVVRSLLKLGNFIRRRRRHCQGFGHVSGPDVTVRRRRTFFYHAISRCLQDTHTNPSLATSQAHADRAEHLTR